MLLSLVVAFSAVVPGRCFGAVRMLAANDYMLPAYNAFAEAAVMDTWAALTWELAAAAYVILSETLVVAFGAVPPGQAMLPANDCMF